MLWIVSKYKYIKLYIHKHTYTHTHMCVYWLFLLLSICWQESVFPRLLLILSRIIYSMLNAKFLVFKFQPQSRKNWICLLEETECVYLSFKWTLWIHLILCKFYRLPWFLERLKTPVFRYSPCRWIRKEY